MKTGKAELARLYEFDLGLADEVAALPGGVAALPPPPPPPIETEATDPTAAFTALANQVSELEARWARRDSVISNLVATLPPEPR